MALGVIIVWLKFCYLRTWSPDSSFDDIGPLTWLTVALTVIFKKGSVILYGWPISHLIEPVLLYLQYFLSSPI